MALGFVKRIFSFGKKAVEETPPDDERQETSPEGLPIPDDAAVKVTDAPDADAHRVAAASVITDAEAGAAADQQPGAEPIPGMPDFSDREDKDAEDEPAKGEDAEGEGGEDRAELGDPEVPEQPPERPQPEQPPEEPAPAPPEQPPVKEPVTPDAPEEVPPSPDGPESEPDIPPSTPQEAPPIEEPAPERPVELPPGPAETPPSVPSEIPPGPSPAELDSGTGDSTAEPKVVTIGEARPAKAAPEAPAAPSRGWIGRLTSGLSRSSRQLSDNISGVFTKRKLDEDTLQDLEDVLIQADLGVETAMRITDALSSGRYGKDVSGEEVRAIMASEVAKVLEPVAQPLELDLSFKPHVILVVGVNGTGKTTTIGKLAAKLRDAGLAVTLGAGDTFRAAAIEQLKIWAERTGSHFVATKLGADAAGLAFEAYKSAKDNGSDVVIIDTAGRLQNKTELMEELAKIVRVLQKHDPDAPHTVLQTLDATTGQNALNQVEIFRNVAGVNGLVMTKLDGTARGGILVAISAKYKLPVYFVGVGESVDDLEPFAAPDFANAIAGIPA
ncbi:signal recognition particle-docking protein FtsY [Oricola cellulosilytica]|uniref:Signal recognition particle receptor FtsY n=1 Tax=Oricola cellulosilytica TaxID=1429082 RepID=A0A4R0PBT9_9HYPH|nr:signal recognition particle-docking protein FtsY [Oricola cellulosilytica]TCD13892.1 signal recognition particle-docking protein FtsY [Oricola cellulosilytica]